MPIYEYRCTECEHEFRKIQGNFNAIKKCPKCGKKKLKKLLSRSAVKFKGSGFYENDYKYRQDM